MTDTDIQAAPLPATEVLFFDGFDDLDSIAPLEILTAAGFPVRPVCVPSHATTVRSAHGLRIGVAGEIGERPDLIIVPGGGWRDESRVGVRQLCGGDLPGLLARLHERGTVVASVCTGAMLLAAAGLLDGRPAVTNRIALDDLERAGADVHREARVVDDGSVVTCGGPAAGIDLALRLVERFRGAPAAAQAAQRLEHEPVGPVLLTSAAAA
jgi:transcriptional regulator GlxA family with amidase domain